MPVRFGLIGPNGSPMSWSSASGDVRGDLLVLSGQSADLRIQGRAKQAGAVAVPRVLGAGEDRLDADARPTGCSSPATTAIRSTAGSRCRTWRWPCCSTPYGGTAWAESDLDALADALERHHQFAGARSGLQGADPDFPVGAAARPHHRHQCRSRPHPCRAAQAAHRASSSRLEPTLSAAYRANVSTAPYSTDTAQSGQRSLKNGALGLLVIGGSTNGATLAREQYHAATNMTDRYAALAASGGRLDAPTPRRCSATSAPCTPPIRWCSTSGSASTRIAPEPGVVDRVRAILADPSFPRNNPNRLRALVGTFGHRQPVAVRAGRRRRLPLRHRLRRRCRQAQPAGRGARPHRLPHLAELRAGPQPRPKQRSQRCAMPVA